MRKLGLLIPSVVYNILKENKKKRSYDRMSRDEYNILVVLFPLLFTVRKALHAKKMDIFVNGESDSSIQYMKPEIPLFYSKNLKPFA